MTLSSGRFTNGIEGKKLFPVGAGFPVIGVRQGDTLCFPGVLGSHAIEMTPWSSAEGGRRTSETTWASRADRSSGSALCQG